MSAAHAHSCEVRLYEHLFTKADPESVDEAAKDAEAESRGEEQADPRVAEPWLANLNLNSLSILHAFVEPSVANAAVGARYQFERHGYFCVDPDSTNTSGEESHRQRSLVFNRVVSLKDSWAKEQKKS